MTFQQFNINNSLTSVDLCSTQNFSGIYYNGSTNNGVGSTLSSPSSSVQIDNIVLKVGDEILLKDQTNTNENGIYVCKFSDNIKGTVLERRNDFHCIEQLNGGQYLTCSNGVENKGQLFIFTDPVPDIFGIGGISFVSSNDNNVDINLSTSFPGNVIGFQSRISDSLPINQIGSSLETIKGIISINGVVDSGNINVVSAQFFGGTGNYVSTNSMISGVKSLIDLGSVTNINFGNDICGLKSVFQNISNVTNNAGLKGIASYNFSSTSKLFCHYHAQGRADNLFNIQDSLSDFFLSSGTSNGSAGDPVKCNAPNVLKIFVNSINYYIPIFNQNT